jgi:hypothetical protein
MSVCRFVTRGSGPWAVLVVIGVLVSTGCEPGGYSGPTGTVSGTVTLNGQPVPQGCTVAVISDAGHTASGRVGAGGQYSLSVVGEGGKMSAIPAATYKVCVTPPAGAETSGDYDQMMEQSASGGGQAAEAPAQEEIIPAAFQTTATSGLSYQVEEGQQTIDIELE